MISRSLASATLRARLAISTGLSVLAGSLERSRVEIDAVRPGLTARDRFSDAVAILDDELRRFP